jgi:FtsP/CotA-like multicopper oxidase with cupredoxin domain
MMLNLRFLAGLLCVLLVILGLSACSDGSDSFSGGVDASSQAPESDSDSDSDSDSEDEPTRNLADGPPEDDPSALSEMSMESLPEDRYEANHYAFEGGASASPQDTSANNEVPKEDQRDDGTFNVPTNGPPSPLFGAEPFTQQMLRFEEFGTQALTLAGDADSEADETPEGWSPLPMAESPQSIPAGDDLESFLSQEIFPTPTVFANDSDLNPWASAISAWLGRDLDTPPAEGRPPGEGWSHQRWDDFTPRIYFQTATTGARVNGGFRDNMQRHGYGAGEFGPGGLYHNTAGVEGFEGSTQGLAIRFHPDMPEQDPLALWTFDGTFPPKLLNVRYGEPLIMRHYNALPIDVAANRGFGLHTLTTHEHNGHYPAESDGYTNAFFFPGQFYDYRWPITLAGTDSINTDASDDRAGAPDGQGGITRVPGDWRETMSTHWFHDHMLDFTAQNVYKGSAAMMNYYSALDRGNEAIDDGVNLRLPSGTALDWGNRDYDVNLLLAEKAWDREGQLWFNPFNVKGFIGDVMTVNWLYKPYMEVRARQYRFRILNGSVSRYFKVALIDGEGNPVPFHMVANDGNIMEHTVHFENGELPTLGIAERYDIVVDFSDFEEGDVLYLVNMLQHKDGESTDEIIPLTDIVSGTYVAVEAHDDDDGIPDRWIEGDPVVGPFLEFRVQAYDGEDLSMDPADYVAGKEKLIPLNRPTEADLETALHRTFEFERQPTDDKPWVIETDGGKGFNMDPRRLSAAPNKNSGGLEVWRLLNSGTWSHPIHIHFEEGIILRRNGEEPPEWEKWARKDVYRLGPQPDSGTMVEVALRFREFAGTYMEHCHNTQHEDHAMLLRWDIEHPGQTKLMPTPIPSWDGVSYVDTHALPTFRTGDGTGQYGPEIAGIEQWVADAVIGGVDLEDVEIGDALNPTEDERASATFPLMRGINNDDGVETEVFFFLHDISDERLAEEMGLAWAGALSETPAAALGDANRTEEGDWTFYGDLPNPVTAIHDAPEDTPAQSDDNTYTPLRRVNINGESVIVNAIFVKWGENHWEQMRIDETCVGFPDDPPNTACPYNGSVWGGFMESGHAIAIDTDSDQPTVTLKLHKSWAEDADYLPYYIVLDSYPAGPANAMGVPYVPKHQFLGKVAVPLVQFLPGEPIHETFPPTPADGYGLFGGGPLGGQIGLPSYFMPEDDYSPMWHIGFAHWLEPATEVVKGLDRVKELRAQGYLEINEFPPPAVGLDNYDFENLNSPHVVNCPTPFTIDRAMHTARKLSQQARE